MADTQSTPVEVEAKKKADEDAANEAKRAAALDKAKCPDCGRSLDVYQGDNEHKQGTGYCSFDGKRYQLS